MYSSNSASVEMARFVSSGAILASPPSLFRNSAHSFAFVSLFFVEATLWEVDRIRTIKTSTRMGISIYPGFVRLHQDWCGIIY